MSSLTKADKLLNIDDRSILNPSDQLTNDLNITALFLGCQVNSGLWVPVKKMVWSDIANGSSRSRFYRTSYVGGVKQAMAGNSLWQNFFGLSPLEQVDITREVHVSFAKRMPLARPHEIAAHCLHLGLPTNLLDPIAYVGRSGGYRQTDSFDVFPEIRPDLDGNYRFFFCLQGLEHLADLKVIKQTSIPGDRAVADGRKLFNHRTGEAMGFLPGYIQALIVDQPDRIRFQLEQINNSLYTNYQLLCSATCHGFVPFTSPLYLPISFGTTPTGEDLYVTT